MDFPCDVTQTRIKLERCVYLCRDAAMKIKAASGIKRFREEYRFGKWFGKLYPVITYSESSQPGQSFEASALNGDRKVF